MDATVGHPWISFLDAFQGYHQIPLALTNQEKTALVMPTRNYHYKVMPFGLKSARSTYQRIITRMFKPQLDKNNEVYIDDMVMKNKVEAEHVNDFGSIFKVLRKHKLCLILLNVPLVLVQASFWVIWSPTVGLKLTLIRLKQSMVYNLLGIPEKSKS